MQVLKEEVHEAIEQAAIEEFYRHGYKKSSMRNIAHNAGISVGNLYRYFENKEALFIVVMQPALNAIKHYIRHHHDNMPDVTAVNINTLANHQTELLSNVLVRYRRELLILVDSADDSPLYDAVDELVELIQQHNNEELGKLNLKSEEPAVMESLLHVMSTGILNGCIEIIRMADDEDKIRKLTRGFIEMFIKGLDTYLR